MTDRFEFRTTPTRPDGREDPVDDGMLEIEMRVDVFGGDRVLHLPTETAEGNTGTDVPDCIIWNIDGANFV